MSIGGAVCVVTGAGNGIGRAVALELLLRGAKVAALDVDKDGLDETQALAGAAAVQLTTHVADITDRDRLAELPDEIAQTHGQVDAVFNIAGIIQPFEPVADLDRATIERVMDINFWGVVNMIDAFRPTLESRPFAWLVNVSSMGALTPVPGQTMYGASKAAVKLLTEGLRSEYQGTGLSVTLVVPGGVATNITENSGVDNPGNGDPATVEKYLLSPEKAARGIVDAAERRSSRCVLGADAKAMDALSRISPLAAATLMRKGMNTVLDKAGNAPARQDA